MALVVSSSKGAYRALCEREPSIPLFAQAWWLDAVAGDQWEVVLAYQNDKVVGTLPYVRRDRFGWRVISQPKLTQALGPWIRPSQKTYCKALAYEKDVLTVLAQGLPRFSHYAQNWDPERKNWLPFYWLGFNQTTRYSYRLDLRVGLDTIWSNFQKDVRGNVKKARNRFGVSVRQTDDIEELVPVLRQTFARQNKTLPFSTSLLSRIDNAAAARGKRQIILGEDGDGRLHAGTYIVWQNDTVYQLLNGYDPNHRESGGGSLCVWSAIQASAEHAQVYDFEGSMLEPVERFFRSFGAMQVPYFRISRTPSRLLQAATCLQSLVKS